MAAQKTTAAEDVLAMAFLNTARQYHEAADVLLTAQDKRTKAADSQTIKEPTYYLYLHTVELALKAFLRAHGLPILGTDRMSYKLTELYEECRGLGLVIGPDDRFTIGNIVGLLESGNVYQGFRYFTLKSRTMPSLEWTREVVAALMQVVSKEVEARDDPKEGRQVVKGDITLGKPMPKVKP